MSLKIAILHIYIEREEYLLMFGTRFLFNFVSLEGFFLCFLAALTFNFRDQCFQFTKIFVASAAAALRCTCVGN